MKKTIGIAACAAAVLLLASCAKEGQGLFKGNYTFKTSGSVYAELSIENTDGNSSSTLDLDLETEQGQMDILKTGSGDGGMIVTMNVLGGDVRSFRARAEGSTLIVEPFDTKIKLQIARHGTATIDVTASGSAKSYGDVVIFDLVYEGEGVSEIGESTAEVKICGSSVQCIAKLND